MRSFAKWVVTAGVAALLTGCGSSPLRSWFAAERTVLTSKQLPAEPIFVEVLGGGELPSEIENEISARFRRSKYLKRASSPDSRLFLEVEPLDSYFEMDSPGIGPDVMWTAIVFRARLLEVGSDKPLLEGVVASYKGYTPGEWDKLLKPGLRRAAIIDGVGKLIGLMETNTPKPDQATVPTAAPAAPPTPPPSEGQPVNPLAPPPSQPVQQPAGGGKTPAPH